ncbi:MAG: VOC family protein [Solirubrobacteraceae bacterium]
MGGEPAPWRELGFALEGARLRVGSVTVRVDPAAGRGLVAWSLRGLQGADLDGLPTTLDDGAPPASAPASAHPNRALAVDHVVVVTPDLERTLAALGAAGLELRRRREGGSPQRPAVQAFYRLGEVVLEVVGSAQAPPGPARFWGLVFTVADLDDCAAALGDRLGAVHDAVQPGRRIATVRPEVGLGLPVALMSPPAG